MENVDSLPLIIGGIAREDRAGGGLKERSVGRGREKMLVLISCSVVSVLSLLYVLLECGLSVGTGIDGQERL